MSNRWRRKPESESKPDEAVWGDDDAGEPEAGAAGKPEADGTVQTGPQPQASSASPVATVAPDPEATPSTASSDHSDDDVRNSEPSEPETTAGTTTAATTTAEPSAGPGDEFDALGAEVADVLRHTREIADRVRAEADEQARATIAEAEQQAAATIAEAEQKARDQRAEAEREIEEARAEVARQLEEASTVLTGAQDRDRVLRGQAEQHLADSLAAREAGRAILERATERLARAETVAKDLAAQVEMARLEVGPIATELQALAEQYGALVLGEKTATVPGGVDGEPGVIDLRDSAAPSPGGPPGEPATGTSVGDGEADAGVHAPSDEGEPAPSTESSEQL